MVLKVKNCHFLTIRELDLYDPNDKSYVMRTIGSLKRRDVVSILYKTRRFWSNDLTKENVFAKLSV